MMMSDDEICKFLRQADEVIAELRSEDEPLYEIEVRELAKRRDEWIASADQPNVDTPTLLRLMGEQQLVVNRHKEAITAKISHLTALVEEAIAACHCHRESAVR